MSWSYIHWSGVPMERHEVVGLKGKNLIGCYADIKVGTNEITCKIIDGSHFGLLNRPILVNLGHLSLP